MNSYNENLRAATVTLLQEQELEKKKSVAQLNASMFSLYYANGAVISAKEKLETDTQDLNKKTSIYTKAVQSCTMSVNLLAAATRADSYVRQSVNTTAVAAANLQIAANAVLKLAGDMGNIFSIVNAADFGSEIYMMSKNASELMNQTANLAEESSGIAMDASLLTSEVSMSAVFSKSGDLKALMEKYLQIATADNNSASTLVATDTINLSATSVTEKISESNFENCIAEYRTAIHSYQLSNVQLNLGLSLQSIDLDPDPSEKDIAAHVTTRNIKFNLITSPFAPDRKAAIKPDTSVPLLTVDDYPVSAYYLMLVTIDKQSTFTSAMAENIVSDNNHNFIRLNVAAPTLTKPTAKNPSGFHPSVITFVQDTTVISTVPVVNGQVDFTVNFLDLNGKGAMLKDSDGIMLTPARKYVVFLMAEFDSTYKKRLSTFDNYLSAASLPFTMSHVLASAVNITVSSTATENSETNSCPFRIKFDVSENPEYSKDVHYRCLILPKITSPLHDKNRAGISPRQNKSKKENTEVQKAIAAASEDYMRSTDEIRKQTNKFGFNFNLKLAEQVFAGNYCVAIPAGKAKQNPKGFLYPLQSYVATFGSGTTDNFGNALVPGLDYTIVILSINSSSEQKRSAHNNNWTGGTDEALVQFTYVDAYTIVPLDSKTLTKKKQK